MKQFVQKHILCSLREVFLRIFTESHNVSKCNFAMGALKRAMKWDEDRYWKPQNSFI